jgi:hypothetical protein
MKAGDEWAGIKIDSINQEKVVFSRGGTSKDVHLGEALPEAEAKLLSAAEASEEGAGDDGESPTTTESATTSSPPKFRKTSTEPKTQTSDEQNRVLDEMKRKNKKKNRPGADE